MVLSSCVRFYLYYTIVLNPYFQAPSVPCRRQIYVVSSLCSLPRHLIMRKGARQSFLHIINTFSLSVVYWILFPFLNCCFSLFTGNHRTKYFHLILYAEIFLAATHLTRAHTKGYCGAGNSGARHIYNDVNKLYRIMLRVICFWLRREFKNKFHLALIRRM